MPRCPGGLFLPTGEGGGPLENKRGRNAIPQFCTRPITLNIAVNDDDELYEGEISSWQKYAALPW